VYALGAILHELISGVPPFDGTHQEILLQLSDAQPEPLRRVVPGTSPHLERVVLCALEKEPAYRYRSATAFAQDLALALHDKPPEQIPSIPRLARIKRRIGRHPLAAAALAAAVSLALLLVVGVVSARNHRVAELERAQQMNASIAGMQAVAVSLQLKAYKQRLAELSRDPEVLALVASPSPGIPSPVLLARRAPFDSMFVMTADGRQAARTSAKPPAYLARSFTFRDYFQGARALAAEVCREGWGTDYAADQRRAHLARAFRSESDGNFEFAISAPLCDGTTWIGVLGVTAGTDAVLGAVRLLDDRHGRTTAVLGPRDRERNAASLPLPTDLTFIVHPGLVKGQAQHLLDPSPAVIRGALGIANDARSDQGSNRLRYAAPYRADDYRDPTPGYGGRWSAVFAAADESGFVVAVASRRSEGSFARRVYEQIELPLWVLLGLGLLGSTLLGLEQLRRASLRPVRS